MSFDILAAIDLRGGRVVRLREGDFGREQVYDDDPIAVGEAFAAAGARWLHVVDLDGARRGRPAHGRQIRSLLSALGDRTSIEIGGGVRSAAAARAVLAAGARRVVFGTAALRDPELVRRMVAEHGPAAVAVAIDVRDQQAVGHGWLRDAPGADPVQSITTLAAIGVRTFEVTAIDRDGSLEGPDVAGLQRVVALGAGEVIASGGIRSLADLEAVRDIGCRGAIVGRALYEGGLDLAAAIALFQAPTEPSPTTSCQ